MRRSLVRTRVRSALTRGEDVLMFWVNKSLEDVHEDLVEILGAADCPPSYELRPAEV